MVMKLSLADGMKEVIQESIGERSSGREGGGRKVDLKSGLRASEAINLNKCGRTRLWYTTSTFLDKQVISDLFLDIIYRK